MTNGRKKPGSAVRHAVTLIIFTYCITEFALVAKAASIVSKDDAMRYLSHYGYMSSVEPSSQTLVDDSMSSAISKFQEFMGMDVTGKLDVKTTRMIMLPRCGVPDMVEQKTGDRKKRKAYQDSKWNVKNLTYRISNYPAKLDKIFVDKEIARAFAVWSKYTDLTFSPSSGEVHIDIRFYRGDHGDHNPFDGPGHTLAHAFYPAYGGHVHFDNDEVWTIMTYKGFNLFQVAAHEFGHALGLEHSSIKSALMWPYYEKYDPYLKLDKDDIFEIQALYGPKIKKAPAICEDPKVDAMLTYTDGHTYAFKGNYYWKLTGNEIAAEHPKLISEKWSGLPGDIDATFTYEGWTYFFKGSKYWRYINQQMGEPFSGQISQGFPGIPDNIDTATVWTGDGQIYFYKGTKFWRFDFAQKAYPEPISWWEGVPDNLDAAVVYEGYTFFFKDYVHYRFNDETFSVDQVDPPFPRPNDIWFDCSDLANK